MSSEYFTQADWSSRHLPKVSWEEMLSEHKLLSPSTLVAVLADAKDFLLKAEGPHLLERNIYVPGWFDYWLNMLNAYSQITEEIAGGPFVGNSAIMMVEDVASYVASRAGESGVENMGGGEGTEGHTTSYRTIRNVLGTPSTVVWAFERDSYFAKHKERPLPFLELPIRLSMSVYLGVDVVTIYPEVPDTTSPDSVSKHYLDLFRALGVGYSFADESDPHAEEKSRRGKTDRPTLIPHMAVPSTRVRVMKLLEDIADYKIDHHASLSSDDDDEQDFLELMLPEVFQTTACRLLAEGAYLR